MTINDAVRLTGAKVVTPDVDVEREISTGCVCDLLSWVMTHGRANMAWVTVQTHMNVIAVAALLEFSCVILPNGIDMPQNVVDKAIEEGIAVLQSPMNAYEVCGCLYSAGLKGADRA